MNNRTAIHTQLRDALGSALVCAFVGGCGGVVTIPSDADSTATGSSTTDASTTTTSNSTASASTTEWPKRVVLVTPAIATPSDGLMLSDGVFVDGDGDLSLWAGKVIAIGSPTPASFCDKGVFAALADVPTAVASCPGSLSGGWEQGAYLSATSLHTTEESYVIGRGMLVWDAEHTALYRLRIVGDSYDTEGVSTATFDYEPAP